ncbi:3-dehydroquinate dehydratase (3-dehydroquinase) [Polyrhizophydium stewartii]|uniref:Pentafunctional AROM polypeptide n=1 Tax=Polyrhizophydium stewartii TaxID=2732419 RepID=A0ABR4N9K6_9FUNG
MPAEVDDVWAGGSAADAVGDDDMDEDVDSYILEPSGVADDGQPRGVTAATCSAYEMLPVALAIHPPVGVNCLAATRDFRWVFTGAEDGFIRKFDMLATMNGETMLTQTQRHGMVDTVQKSALLISAWENESKPTGGGPGRVSPVYSMDVHSEGVWCLTGVDGGGVNLWTVRHDEGTCAHVFDAHTNTVSVIRIGGSEHTFLTGSWDKTVKLWSLDTGRMLNEFRGPSSQITSAAFQPVPARMEVQGQATDDGLVLVTSFDGTIWVFDSRVPGGLVKKLPSSLSSAPPWTLSACWSNDGSRIYCGRRNGSVDEFDFAEGTLIKSIKLPLDSGPVSLVQCMPNGRHLLCASNDNIRLWDLQHEPEAAPTTPADNVGLDQPMAETEAAAEGADARFPSFADDFMDHDPFGHVLRAQPQPSAHAASERPERKSRSLSKLIALNEQDLQMPFTIVPGHHGGMVSAMVADEAGRIAVCASGNRGWEGQSTHACLVYTVSPQVNLNVMVQRVSILGTDSIVVGSGLAQHIADEVLAAVPASSYVVVTDENVARLHLEPLLAALRSALAARSSPARVLSVVIPAGEVHKTRETKAAIEDWLLAQSCTRDSCLLALGGGVLGDLVGFVAATFMRGVPVVQIPTTLLAMVDSSVGGKTAIDTPHGKNLVGAFHQPRRIFIDILYLATLPRREFVNGLAEVIKTAAIWDESDFEMLENYPDKILGLVGSRAGQDPESVELLVKLILGSVRVKAHVVTVDEKETGLRGLLNFGHSVGHAIEAILFPQLLHGECVAIGMVKEAEMARFLGHLNNVSVGRLVRCLQAYGLPVSVDDKLVRARAPGKHCPVDRLLDIMRVDKKNQGDKKRIVLLSAIGKTLEPRASFVADDVIRKILSPAVRVSAPSGTVDVSLAVPGSKSISNRALVMAALGSGTCRLHGLLHSDDVQVMLDALQKLVGITYAWENNGETLVITGGGGKLRSPSSEIYLGNAGTASRFLTTVCTLIREVQSPDLAQPPCAVLTGNARMKQRPIGPLVEALRSNNCSITYLESQGCLPIAIKPSKVGLAGGHIRLSASVSSQYVSSILISAPYAASPVTLDLTGDAVVSQPYIDMTIAMMKSFGIHVERVPGTNKYNIPQGVYTNPAEYLVEADASSATYPLAFAAITGSRVRVTNIGSNSLQGDAEFAIKVLREMGCDVHQTESTTTVQGPAVLKPIPSIDMEPMTDAFMTATVLAAIARNPGDADGNTTRITGIANQRVKECDRIAAMVEQLAFFGVSASELPDGIQIHGIDRAHLKHSAPARGVKCYDDHRIAMSFSVLACAVAPQHKDGVIITEKKCVEKTWPSWWDTLENTLGVELAGVDLQPPGHAAPSGSNAAVAAHPTVDSLDPASIVIVGMRGAGKTHMGRAAARLLRREFIDMDVYFEKTIGTTIADIIATKGWDEFRRLEMQCLSEVLAAHPTGAVIATGGGIVETESAREAIKSWKGLVIHLRRNMDDVEAYLGIDRTRPSFGEDIRAVFARREPWYKQCAPHAEFVVPSKPKSAEAAGQHWARVEKALERFLRFKLSRTPHAMPHAAARIDSPAAPLSFFVSLTYPNVASAASFLSKITEGAAAIELRADLLESTDTAFVGEQVALLRTLSPLPIVFTVRTVSQGGRFPDDRFDDMLALLECGVRWGCEYIDVELTRPFERFDKLLRSKGNALIIGSYHDCRGAAVWKDTAVVQGTVHIAAGGVAGPAVSAAPVVRMRQVYQDMYPHADIIKLIGVAHALSDNFDVFEFQRTVAATLGVPPKPLIALLMGSLGQLSRALNTFMTPVTHAAIPTPAAPGQLSIAQIHALRASMGLLPARKFYLFGSPISASMSPMLHNTGFEALGLPHRYGLAETDKWERVRDMIAADGAAFGGASVTIPLKVDVLQHGVATHVSEAARAIGAINTLYARQDGSIAGDNTDWIGIRRSIETRLAAADLVARPIVGVVLGAGGTARAACYALKQLPGVRAVRVWNRTHAKAVSLASEFGCAAVESLAATLAAEPGADGAVFAVVGTVPAGAQDSMDLAGAFAATAGAGGVVVEMAYRPRETRLLSAAAAASTPASPWLRVEGIDVLIEQGLEQFSIWTGLPPPAATMSAAVLSHY